MPGRIARAAIAQVGVPFRLHGRVPGLALDCVGLVAHCLGAAGKSVAPPNDYTLRGSFQCRLSDFFHAHGLCRADICAPQSGDVGVVLCAPRQSHLMIRAGQGWVHAHAGLGRVVHMPDPSPWQLTDIWRI